MKLIGEKPLTAAERTKRYEKKYGAEYIKQKSHDRYLRNKERVLERSKEWASNNPEKVLEKAARYRDKYPDRTKESQQKHDKKPEAKIRFRKYAQSEKGRAYKNVWMQANIDKVRKQGIIHSSARRARLENNGVYLVVEKDLRRLFSSDCVVCKTPGEHVDHIIPVSRGGQHAVGNLQMLCASCNLSKNNKTMIEWRAYKMLVAA
jgi:5-methylcytosine-specific restriction endonuclease McrA